MWCIYREEWSFSFFLIGQFQYCFLLFVCGLGFGCFLHLLLFLFIVFLCKRAKNSLRQLAATLNCSCSKRESIKKRSPTNHFKYRKEYSSYCQPIVVLKYSFIEQWGRYRWKFSAFLTHDDTFNKTTIYLSRAQLNVPHK